MADDTLRSLNVTAASGAPRRLARSLRRFFEWFEARFPFGSVTRRIVILNLFGLAILVSGILFLNQFRAGLIDAKVQSLLTQGEIIAGAIASSTAIETDRFALDNKKVLELDSGKEAATGEENFASLEFPINPERAAPTLRQLVAPTGTRARIYNQDGALILDSDTLYARGQILRYQRPSPAAEEQQAVVGIWRRLQAWLWHQDLPLYKEIGSENGKAYPEVASALTGTPVPIVRVNKKSELVVSVAIPIRRKRPVLGVLLLSTRGGDIDSIVTAERWAIVRVSLFAVAVTGLLSVLLARTIAGPLRRLAAAAEQVRRRTRGRAEIPDYSHRSDEIGHLSGTLRDMTTALYGRLDAIESFAADVAHELKNPLTSLKSAAETLRLVRRKEEREHLMQIIEHDVRRLDRLISDISDASRLDAELAREGAEPVDVAELLETLVPAYNDIHLEKAPKVVLEIAPAAARSGGYVTHGYSSRLGQVVTNLLDNAISFSPKNGWVKVRAQRLESEIEIAVEDEGPGIPTENAEKIFERFYTDRPGEDDFGQNSGLGLNISRQIVVAHRGRIWAENRIDESARSRSARSTGAKGRKASARKRKSNVLGARFVIRLPAA